MYSYELLSLRKKILNRDLQSAVSVIHWPSPCTESLLVRVYGSPPPLPPAPSALTYSIQNNFWNYELFRRFVRPLGWAIGSAQGLSLHTKTHTEKRKSELMNPRSLCVTDRRALRTNIRFREFRGCPVRALTNRNLVQITHCGHINISPWRTSWRHRYRVTGFCFQQATGTNIPRHVTLHPYGCLLKPREWRSNKNNSGEQFRSLASATMSHIA